MTVLNDYVEEHPDRLFDLQMPIGGIILFPANIYITADADGQPVLADYLRLGGWREAAGQILDQERFPALFAVIGDRYNLGDEPPQTFRIPDLRGLFVRGVQNLDRTQSARIFLDDPDATAGRRLDYRKLTGIKPSEPGMELVGTVQKQELIEHQHPMLNLAQLSGGDKSPLCQAFSQVGTGRCNTAPDGGIETRPTNIALYYLIKVEAGCWRMNR